MMPGLEVEAENRGEPAQCYGDMKQQLIQSHMC